jgi:hypothetical protein
MIDDTARRCVRVSTKLALFCCFPSARATDRKDNPIAHHVQYFSHLLN